MDLGAQVIAPRGDGDDQHYLGVDGALDPWIEQVIAGVLEVYPLTGRVEIDKNAVPPPRYTVVVDRVDEPDYMESSQVRGQVDSNDWADATVVSNTRMTPKLHFQDVRHICLETTMAYWFLI